MPHRFASLALSLALLCAPLGPAFAQAGPAEDPDAAEIGEPDEPRERGGRDRRAGRDGRGDRRANSEAVRQRQINCRRDAARQNLRGNEARDFATICVAEARLACLKRAVGSRVRGSARREYIARCLAET